MKSMNRGKPLEIELVQPYKAPTAWPIPFTKGSGTAYMERIKAAFIYYFTY
jgi:hypothetical protein